MKSQIDLTSHFQNNITKQGTAVEEGCVNVQAAVHQAKNVFQCFVSDSWRIDSDSKQGSQSDITSYNCHFDKQ